MHNIVPYLLDGKGDGGMRIPTPTKCPVCGHNLDMRNLRTIRCTNPECQSKKLGDIIRYCETLKMMGVSKGTLTKLFEMGYVKSIPDLYKIDYQSLALEKGFAETSCNAIRRSIEASSVNVEPYEWFGALPCLNVSQKTWKTIFDVSLKHDEGFFELLVDEIDKGDCESFLQVLIQPIIGIGPATWGAIAECFRNNWDDIRETIVNIRFIVDIPEDDNKQLVCLSGTRDETVTRALEMAGYAVTDSWSHKVDILLIPDGDYRSSKVNKALKHHVPIFTVEDAMVNIINTGKIW
jgi:NAD-dependent DNA ligase